MFLYLAAKSLDVTAQSQVTNPTKDRTNIQIQKCIICNRTYVVHKRKKNSLCATQSDSTKRGIIEALTAFDLPFKADEIKNLEIMYYHKLCLQRAQSQLKSKKNKKFTSNAKKMSLAARKRKRMHLKSIQSMRKIINQAAFENKGVCSLAALHRVYLAIFHEHCLKNKLDLPAYGSTLLAKNLLEIHPNLEKFMFRTRTYFHEKNLHRDVVLEMCVKEAENSTSKLTDIAWDIRKDILTSIEQSNNEDLNNENPNNCDIPTNLFTLIKNIIDEPENFITCKKEEMVRSICKSIIDNVLDHRNTTT